MAKANLKLGSLSKTAPSEKTAESDAPAASASKEDVSNAVADAYSAGGAVRKERKLLDWQKDKRAVTAWLPKEQYRALNELHVEDERSVRGLMEEAVDLYLLVRGKLPVKSDRAGALLEAAIRKRKG